jgi:hypothetical protein
MSGLTDCIAGKHKMGGKDWSVLVKEVGLPQVVLVYPI